MGGWRVAEGKPDGVGWWPLSHASGAVRCGLVRFGAVWCGLEPFLGMPC